MSQENEMLFAKINAFLRSQRNQDQDGVIPNVEEQRAKAHGIVIQEDEVFMEITNFPRGNGFGYDSPHGFSLDWEYVATNFEWTYLRVPNDDRLIEIGRYTNSPPIGVFSKCEHAKSLGVDTLTYIEISTKEPVDDPALFTSRHFLPKVNSTYYFFDRSGNFAKLEQTTRIVTEEGEGFYESNLKSRLEIKEMQDDDWTDVSSVLANALTLLQQGPH